MARSRSLRELQQEMAAVQAAQERTPTGPLMGPEEGPLPQAPAVAEKRQGIVSGIVRSISGQNEGLQSTNIASKNVETAKSGGAPSVQPTRESIAGSLVKAYLGGAVGGAVAGSAGAGIGTGAGKVSAAAGALNQAGTALKAAATNPVSTATTALKNTAGNVLTNVQNPGQFLKSYAASRVQPITNPKQALIDRAAGRIGANQRKGSMPPQIVPIFRDEGLPSVTSRGGEGSPTFGNTAYLRRRRR